MNAWVAGGLQGTGTCGDGARGLRLVIFVFFGFRASSGHGPPVTFPLDNRPICIGHGPPFISGPGGRCARGVSWKGTNITTVEKEDEAGDCEERRDQASDSEDLQT